MKNPLSLLISFLLVLVFACPVSATPEPDVVIGEPLRAVLAKLGPPTGQFQQGSQLTLYYSRGMIEFTDGLVVKSTLVSSDEARQIRQERERIEAAQRKQAEADRLRLTREGAAELKKRLADKAFAAQPAPVRLAAWQDFSRRYPFTDVTSHLSAAQQEVDQLQRAQQTKAEIPPLKKRLAEIQARYIQLDKDYAASLAHWKRNEITAERAKLKTEQADLESRLRALEPPPAKP